MASEQKSPISLEYKGRVAIITIDNQQKLNALNQAAYYDLAQKLREIATHDEVFITVLLAKGRYFSAGADVTIARASPSAGDVDIHKHWLQNFVAFNLNITHAFSTHPKILVVGLNGPVALIMSRRISADQLVQAGFVNAIFDVEKGDDARFHELVLREVDERLGEHLSGSSLLGIKKLIRRPELEVTNEQNVHEVFAGLERFVQGIPQEEFRKIASGEKKHKL
ncbi:unnamed protein product [Clonostachys rosea f. rosea IK726]|uniref:Enoyl-CoA hydratase/isomerase domain-containing protein n=2 Tax=Bionectria ochroleuca TaxID=29856 RepID=A0A0B7JTR9_BIOOC|nr:unnamed protein product [Clonostachys rosea f. rosea IK726]